MTPLNGLPTGTVAHDATSHAWRMTEDGEWQVLYSTPGPELARPGDELVSEAEYTGDHAIGFWWWWSGDTRHYVTSDQLVARYGPITVGRQADLDV